MYGLLTTEPFFLTCVLDSNTTFGNLSLAYGAGIVIPALQRQHSDPSRMPRIVFVTITFISCLFLILAGSGYSAVGCQISGNLLFTIYPSATTGLTKLGFSSDKGMVVLAYLFMQLHITIAFAVIVSPAFYILERLVLGMHKKKPEDIEANNYNAVDTPADGIKERSSKGSVVSMADIEKESLDNKEEAAEYRGGSVVVKYILLHISCVVILVILSVLLKDHFLDLADFIAASAIIVSCIILPITFYFKKLWNKISMYEKVAGILVVAICFALGCYVTYLTSKNLFTPGTTDPNTPNFPFCSAEYQFNVYYNKTASISA